MTAVLDRPVRPARLDTAPAETAPTRPEVAPIVGWVGLLLGAAAAIPGIPPFLPVFGVRPWHLLVGAAFILALTSRTSRAVSRLHITALDLAVVVYVVATVVVEYTNAGDLGFAFDPIGAITPLFYVVGYLAARLMIASREDARRFLVAFALPAFPVGLVSVLQLGSPGFSRVVLSISPGPGLAERIVDGRLIRATGFVGHWTGLGFYFCTALAAACAALLLTREGERRITLPVGAALGGSAVGALSSLTISVLATVTAIVLVTLVLIGLRIGRVVVIGVIAFLCYLQFGSYLDERFSQQTAYRPEYLPGWVPNTIAYRWKIWTQQTIPTIEERPWTGWGSGLYTSSWRPRQLVWGSPESQWFGTAISSGIIVAILLALVLLTALGYMLAGIRGREGSWKAPVATLLVCTLIASFTVPAFTNRGLPIGIWVLFGVVLALRGVKDRPSSVEGGGPKCPTQQRGRSVG